MLRRSKHHCRHRCRQRNQSTGILTLSEIRTKLSYECLVGCRNSNADRPDSNKAIPYSHFALEDETPLLIASKFKVDLNELLQMNQIRYPKLTTHSRLMDSTEILLPCNTAKHSPANQSEHHKLQDRVKHMLLTKKMTQKHAAELAGDTRPHCLFPLTSQSLSLNLTAF